MKFNNLKSNKGFTLIELLVVISIIALLSSIVLASTKTVSAKARDSARIQAVHQMDLAVKMYAEDNNGSVPVLGSISGGNGTGCTYDSGNTYANCVARSSVNGPGSAWEALSNALVPKYIPSLPKTLNNIDYVYMAPAAMRTIDGHSNNSSYQISSGLEANSNTITGYTTYSGGLIAVAPIVIGPSESISLIIDGFDEPVTTLGPGYTDITVNWTGTNLTSCTGSASANNLPNGQGMPFYGPDPVNPFIGNPDYNLDLPVGNQAIHILSDYSGTITLAVTCQTNSGKTISTSKDIVVTPLSSQ